MLKNIALTAFLALGLFACGGTEQPDDQTPQTSDVASDSSETFDAIVPPTVCTAVSTGGCAGRNVGGSCIRGGVCRINAGTVADCSCYAH